jgi:glycosyltransferase involved in cell wall biosynthesis
LKQYKKKILRIISSLNPEYGGPPAAIVDSTIALNRIGFKVDIVTHDNKESQFVKIKNTTIHNMGPSLLGDYNLNFKFTKWLIQNRSKYDLFIVHGLWQFNTLAARLFLKKKYYVFVHGQLDPSYKKFFFNKIKKIIYWNLIEKKNLKDSKFILLTNKKEKDLLNDTYVNTKGLKKKVVGYGILEPKYDTSKVKKIFYKKFKSLKDKDFYIYLGRFHNKKGCEIIMNAVKYFSLRKKPINVLMCGSNNIYKKYLQKISKDLNIEKNIIWSNFLKNDIKLGALLSSKAMLLPSYGENFGVALVEAMACGIPVLTTNKVNIYNYIIKNNAGYISSPNNVNFIKIINKFENLKKSNITQLKKNAYRCFRNNFLLSKKIKILAEYING